MGAQNLNVINERGRQVTRWLGFIAVTLPLGDRIVEEGFGVELNPKKLGCTVEIKTSNSTYLAKITQSGIEVIKEGESQASLYDSVQCIVGVSAVFFNRDNQGGSIWEVRTSRVQSITNVTPSK